MSRRAVDVPAEVRGKAATHGAAGARWLRELPVLLDALAREWGLTVGAALPGGSDSYVAEAVTRTGDPAVLQILLPGEAGHAHQTLRLARGRGYVRLLAADEGRNANALAVPGRAGAFKLIAPDGLFAERACDLAVPMREWSGELLPSGDPVGAARDRCALLSRLTGVASRPIWEWGFMERVSSGLLLLQVGRQEEGAEMLAVADALAAAPAP